MKRVTDINKLSPVAASYRRPGANIKLKMAHLK